MNAITKISTSFTGAQLDAKLDEVIDRLNGLIQKEYRLEDYGGWGLDVLDFIRSLNVLWIAAPVTKFSGQLESDLRMGEYREVKFYCTRVDTSTPFPDGQSVTVEGAANPLNNGEFWISGTSHKVIDGFNVLEVILHGPSGAFVAAGSSGAQLTAGTIIKGLDKRLENQSFQFNADGTPNPGVNFSNVAALHAILDDVALQTQLNRRFSARIAVGPKIYPMGGGLNLKNRGNIVFSSVGMDQGGFYFLPNSLNSTHGFFIKQGLGQPNTQTIAFIDVFIAAHATQAYTMGDRFRQGTGDLLHFWQKHGEDATASSTKFDNFVGGVDPQFIIVRCRLTRGRNCLVYRGRGDTHIAYNKIGRADVNGVKLLMSDSKLYYNIITACGENALRLERGSNNVQSINNHFYFNGDNKAATIPTAAYAVDGDGVPIAGAPNRSLSKNDIFYEGIYSRLATIYCYCSNFKSHADRYEDTTGPALFFAGNMENTEVLNADFNSITSIGAGSSSFFDQLTTLPRGQGTTYFADYNNWSDMAVVMISKECVQTGGNVIDGTWRSGRNSQACAYFLDLHCPTAGKLYRYFDIRIRRGVDQNQGTGGLITENVPYTLQKFQKYINITGQVPNLEHWSVTIDGEKDLTFHTKIKANADYALTLYDHGNIIAIPAATAERTVSAVGLSAVENGYSVEVFNTGSANILLSGVNAPGGRLRIPPYASAKVKKVAGILVAEGAALAA